MSANDIQIGGTHYQRGGKGQHWDFAPANNMGGLEFNCSKYICRWEHKDGLKDLQKANHYIDKIIELHKRGYCNQANPLYSGDFNSLKNYARRINLSRTEYQIVWAMLFWSVESELLEAKERIVTLMKDAVSNYGE